MGATGKPKGPYSVTHSDTGEMPCCCWGDETEDLRGKGMDVGWGRDNLIHEKSGLPTTRCVWGWEGGGRGASKPETTNRRVGVCGAG